MTHKCLKNICILLLLDRVFNIYVSIRSCWLIVLSSSPIALLIFSLVVLPGVQVPNCNDGFVCFSFQISQILLPEFLRHRCLVFTHFELLMSSFWIDPFIIAVLSTLCNVNKSLLLFVKMLGLYTRYIFFHSFTSDLHSVVFEVSFFVYSISSVNTVLSSPSNLSSKWSV